MQLNYSQFFLTLFLTLFCISKVQAQALTIQLVSSWNNYGEISNAEVSIPNFSREEIYPGAPNRISALETVKLTHMGNGTYELADSLNKYLRPEYYLEINAPNHSKKNVKISYTNFKEIDLYHNNYYQRCKHTSNNSFEIFKINSPLKNMLPPAWSTCEEIDKDHLIETFGSFYIDFENTGSFKRNMVTYVGNGLNRITDYEVLQVDPNAKTFRFKNPLSRYKAYTALFEGLLKTYAVLQAEILTEEMRQFLILKREANRNLDKAKLVVALIGEFTSIYTEIEAIKPLFKSAIEAALDGSGAGLSFRDSMDQEEIDSILIFAAYLEIGDNFFSRLNTLKRNSLLEGDKSFSDALTDFEKKFNSDNTINAETFTRNYISGKGEEALFDIILGIGARKSLAQATLVGYKGLMGVAAPVFIKITVGLAVSYIIVDFIESAIEIDEKKTMLTAAAMLNEHLFGKFSNKLVYYQNDSSQFINDSDYLLYLLNAYFYNEYRAAIYSGVYASKVEGLIKEGLIKYDTPYADTPSKAYEYKMVEVSNEKKEKISELLAILNGGRAKIETREKQLNICNFWSVANSGGVEGTIDRWDMSELPEGVMLDIRYDTKSIPDKLLVEYPVNNEQLNTGWRGDRRYSGQNYPGGIKGPGVGQNFNMFRKLTDDTFVVKVNGVDDGTYWEYQVRCRAPESLITNETN